MKRKLLVSALCVLLCACAFALLRLQHTSPRRPRDRFGGQAAPAAVSADADGDGIDDPQDILEGALAYVSTRPKYKSRYYAGGYPNDGCGVCTDVAAAALKNAGYDLMALVDEDIRRHPERYEVSVRDRNIDYRRVRNLKVYFAYNAVSLTTDPGDIGQWQGGDIVIFDAHIGVVSDRRNRNGVPYVIHHNGPWQRAYEQDILEKRKDIAGHYRMSA